MRNSSVKSNSKSKSLYGSSVEQYVDEFADWLSDKGYRQSSLESYVKAAALYTDWIQSSGRSIKSSTSSLKAYRKSLEDAPAMSEAHNSALIRGTKHFIVFLEFKGLIKPRPPTKKNAKHKLLRDFECWMLSNRGVLESTLNNYRAYIRELLDKINGNPENLTAKVIRRFIEKQSGNRGISTKKCSVKAIRAFIRYLVVLKLCDPSLNRAIPTLPHWRLKSIPKYIQPEDINRVLASIDCTTDTGKRNQSIVLLLARLGMRAGEVSSLKLEDIDWEEGTLTVLGKSRVEAKLPLPQEVGNALLDYITTARPSIDSPYVFIRAVAPLEGITRYAVKHVAAKAIRKAGVQTPSYGAHVLRHSAATSLLREGCSLQTIGELLRHSSIETTAHYAKVDMTLLENVVAPWPGGGSC